jgi:hypothetical protein
MVSTPATIRPENFFFICNRTSLCTCSLALKYNENLSTQYFSFVSYCLLALYVWRNLTFCYIARVRIRGVVVLLGIRPSTFKRQQKSHP